MNSGEVKGGEKKRKEKNFIKEVNKKEREKMKNKYERKKVRRGGARGRTEEGKIFCRDIFK